MVKLYEIAFGAALSLFNVNAYYRLVNMFSLDHKLERAEVEFEQQCAERYVKKPGLDCNDLLRDLSSEYGNTQLKKQEQVSLLFNPFYGEK